MKTKQRSFEDDRDPNTVHPVVVRATNDDGGVYFVKISIPRQDAGKFIRELWESVDKVQCPRDDEDALGEWTHRGRDFRTTYSNFDDAVCIRTHAWHPSGDRRTLDEKVLSFLWSRGLVV
jgi:hypothetical protein